MKRLAIKVTIPSQTHPPHNSKREARMLAAAASKCIIPLLDTHSLSSQFLLVFPFQPFDLATVLRRGFPLNAKAARSILQDLFFALAHIHAKGIIHRDVKPANILLSSPVGPAYLADFGIAWSPDDPASEPSSQKITDVGTTCYRPPELLFGHKAYGIKLDLWAAGCVVAECVRRGFHDLENPSVKVGEAKWTLFDAGQEGNELALIKSMFETLGTPNDETWPVSSFQHHHNINLEYKHEASAYGNSGSSNLPRLEQNVLPHLPASIVERRPSSSLRRSSRSRQWAGHVPKYFETECAGGKHSSIMGEIPDEKEHR